MFSESTTRCICCCLITKREKTKTNYKFLLQQESVILWIMTVSLENGARQDKEDMPPNIPIYKPLTTSHGSFPSYTTFILLPGF